MVNSSEDISPLEQGIADSKLFEEKGKKSTGGIAGFFVTTFAVGALYVLLNLFNPSEALAQSKKGYYKVNPCAKDYKELLIFAKELHWDANLVGEDGLVKSIYTTDTDVNIFNFVDIKEGKTDLGKKIIDGDYTVVNHNGAEYLHPNGSSHYIRLTHDNDSQNLNDLFGENGQVNSDILKEVGDKIGLYGYAAYNKNFSRVNSAKLNLVIFEKGGDLSGIMDDYLNASRILEGLIVDYKLPKKDTDNLTIKLTTVLKYLSDYISGLNNLAGKQCGKCDKKEVEDAFGNFNAELSKYIDPNELRLKLEWGVSNGFNQSQTYRVGNNTKSEVISGEPNIYGVDVFFKLGDGTYIKLDYLNTHGDLTMNNDPTTKVGFTLQNFDGSATFLLVNDGNFGLGANMQANYTGATLRIINDKVTTGGSDEFTQYGLGAEVIINLSGAKLHTGVDATKSKTMGNGYNVTFGLDNLLFGSGKFGVESEGTFGHTKSDQQERDYINFGLKGIYFLTPSVGVLVGYEHDEIKDMHIAGLQAKGVKNQIEVGVEVNLDKVLGGN